MNDYFYILFGAVSFLASLVGAICGVGGGVIIKPVLDAFGILDVEAVSFLSGCTVLMMTGYSVMRSRLSKESLIDMRIGTPLALGAAAGGFFGKEFFQIILRWSSDADRVGAVQAICLLLVTLGTILYTAYKEKIRTKHIHNLFYCGVIGVLLGMMSAFLGIGGGPINLVVLFFFFRWTSKQPHKIRSILFFFHRLQVSCIL